MVHILFIMRKASVVKQKVASLECRVVLGVDSRHEPVEFKRNQALTSSKMVLALGPGTFLGTPNNRGLGLSLRVRLQSH